jgi:hypothetical protein
LNGIYICLWLRQMDKVKKKLWASGWLREKGNRVYFFSSLWRCFSNRLKRSA